MMVLRGAARSGTLTLDLDGMRPSDILQGAFTLNARGSCTSRNALGCYRLHACIDTAALGGMEGECGNATACITIQRQPEC